LTIFPKCLIGRKPFITVPEYVLAELNLPSVDGDYQMFEDYIDELDSLRGTNMREVFLGDDSCRFYDRID